MRQIHLFLVIGIGIALGSCGSINTDKIYDTLKDHEARAMILIDGQEFYAPKNIFKGEFIVFDNSVRVNITDQFLSNIIITATGQYLFRSKPIKKQVDINNQTASSVMVGRIKNKAENTGEGYLITEGLLEIEEMNAEKAVIRFKGRGALFLETNNKEKWQNIEGAIVFKKPIINIQNITKEDAFY
jgi:hypothetical protein